MSREVRFRLHPDDAGAIDEWLQLHGGIVLVQPQPSPALVMSATACIERVEFPVRLWPELLLARVADIPCVVVHEVPAQGYWLVDKLVSPVVEFVPGYRFDSGTSAGGRLWFAASHFDSRGQRVEHDREFLSWADNLVAWVRRNWKRGSSGEYESPSLRTPGSRS